MIIKTTLFAIENSQLKIGESLHKEVSDKGISFTLHKREDGLYIECHNLKTARVLNQMEVVGEGIRSLGAIAV